MAQFEPCPEFKPVILKIKIYRIVRGSLLVWYVDSSILPLRPGRGEKRQASAQARTTFGGKTTNRNHASIPASGPVRRLISFSFWSFNLDAWTSPPVWIVPPFRCIDKRWRSLNFLFLLYHDFLAFQPWSFQSFFRWHVRLWLLNALLCSPDKRLLILSKQFRASSQSMSSASSHQKVSSSWCSLKIYLLSKVEH